MASTRSARPSALRRALAGAPVFFVPAAVSLGVGVGVGAAGLALWRLRTARPLRFAPALEVEAVPPSDFGFDWTAGVRTPGALQTAALESLLEVLAALSALVVAVGATAFVVLLLSRLSARRREFAVRVALGAPRGRFLLRQGAEGARAALAGGALAAVVGWLCLGAVAASLPAALSPAVERLAAPGPVLAVAAAAALLVLLPALLALDAAWRGGAGEELAAGGRATAGRAEGETRALLVVLQVAALLVLLAGAGALVRSAVPGGAPAALGYEPDRVRVARVDLPATLPADERAKRYRAVLDRAAAAPGVEAATLATPGAWLGVAMTDDVMYECGRCSIGGMYAPFLGAEVQHHAVAPGYFQALGVPVLRGRGFGPGDGPGAPRVAVINHAFVSTRQFEGGDPLGKVVYVGGLFGGTYTIVGVVGDVQARGLGSDGTAAPALYLPVPQAAPASADLALRLTGDAAPADSALAAAIRGAAPGAALTATTPLAAELERFAAPVAWLAALILALAAVAAVLAVHGVHSSMRLHVARAEREIAVRMALGALPGRVTRMVLTRSLRLAAAGAVAGVLGAAAVARLLQARVAGLRLFDPPLIAAIAGVLALTALVGALLPARRAARVEPMTSLRGE